MSQPPGTKLVEMYPNGQTRTAGAATSPIAHLKQGDQVVATGRQVADAQGGYWDQVSVNGKTGWIEVQSPSGQLNVHDTAWSSRSAAQRG
ncbi:MAG: hypothetical protein PHO89_06385 [Methylacidiphilaceae bacterium]|nr:hypothetical protein [Candidatus Methylacidiphilaceae bacterium]